MLMTAEARGRKTFLAYRKNLLPVSIQMTIQLEWTSIFAKQVVSPIKQSITIGKRWVTVIAAL